MPRLARHEIVLDDDHRVGRGGVRPGLPVVLVHGFTAEGILYAQTLSRLVGMGFKVVAIDVAGHGGTQGLPTGGDDLESYTELLARVLDELGIRAGRVRRPLDGRAPGHPARGRRARPGDRAWCSSTPCVGDSWDRLIRVSRFAPPVLVGIGAAARGRHAVDPAVCCGTRPRPPSSAGWSAPTLLGHVRRPVAACWARRSR